MEFKPLSIKTIKPLFNATILAYYKLYNINLSYMKIRISEVPLDTKGRPTDKILPEQFGGCHCQNKTIFYNKYFEKAVKYYTGKSDKKTYIETLKTVTAHELAHEIWFKHADDNFKNEIVEKAINSNFQTEYTKTLNKNFSKYKEELFCEYLAYTIKPYQSIVVDIDV